MHDDEVLSLLTDLPLTRGMDAQARGELARLCEWFAVPGGGVLFNQGEHAEDLYVLVSGALGVFVLDPDGDEERLIGQIGPREVVGEIGLITGKGRAATVRCLRDCELLRLSLNAFEQLLRLHPRSSLALSRTALLRSDRWAQRGNATGGRSFALLPQQDFTAAEALAEALLRALQCIGPTRLLHPDRDAGLSSAAYHELEQQHRFLIYLARPQPDAWGALCLRQTDQLLFCAEGAEPGEWPVLSAHPPSLGLRRQRHLISVECGAPRAAGPWLDAMPGARWHRLCDSEDRNRLARLLAGQSTGLVLAGGGARGFAHIGVWKALRALGLPVDRVAGTSIGSIVGAAIAMGWDERELCERVRRSFVDSRPLSDYTFPFVSLVRGQRVTRLLQREFADARIEDLRLPFRCVSTDLTAGAVVVHRRGPVWQALRASSAIPGLLPPVFQQGHVLVDGGVIDNFPLDALNELGSGPVVGVDLGARYRLSTHWDENALPPLWRMVMQWYSGQRRPSIAQILLRVGMINSRRATEHKREQCDLLLKPPLMGIDLLDWGDFQRAVDEGYEETLRAVEGENGLGIDSEANAGTSSLSDLAAPDVGRRN